MKSLELHRKVFFYITLLVLIVLAVIIFFPFFKSVIAAMVLAFVFYPLYKYFNKHFSNHTWSAVLVVVIVLLLILVPFGILLNQVVKESTVAYVSLQQVIFAEKTEGCDGGFCFLVEEVKDLLDDPKIKFYLNESIQKFSTFVAQTAAAVLVSLPKVVLNIFILLITLFFFLRDGKEFIDKIVEIVPLKKPVRSKIFFQFTNISKAVVYGYIVAALIQGIVALIGFYLINLLFSPEGSVLINAPILWALVLALLALVPIIGSGFVWVPMALFFILRGYYFDSLTTLWAGIFLFFYGALVIANIDNIVRPLLAGNKAKIHPLLIFIGIFGGLFAMGIIGLVIGPLVLALLVTYLKLYEDHFV